MAILRPQSPEHRSYSLNPDCSFENIIYLDSGWYTDPLHIYQNNQSK